MQLKAGVTYVAPAFLRKLSVYGDNGSPVRELSAKLTEGYSEP